MADRAERRPRPSWQIGGALVAASLAALPAPVAAHPHVFIDGGVDFHFAPDGRLVSLGITWIYDPLSSLFLMEDLGLAATTDDHLTPEDRAALAASQTNWIEGFEGDSYLTHDGGAIGLSGPLEPRASLDAGRVVFRFERLLDAPVRPDETTRVEVYDPTYFVSYIVTETPVLTGGAEGCAARVVPFEPTGPLAALQVRLSAIPLDGTPEEANVGALFAEKVHISCD